MEEKIRRPSDETPNAETLAAFAELDNGGGYRFNGDTEELFKELLKDGRRD